MLIQRTVAVLEHEPQKLKVANEDNMLEKDEVERFDFEDKENAFTINSFQRLGWFDPFPKEASKQIVKNDTERNERVIEAPSKNWIYPDMRMDIGSDSPM